MDGYAMLLFSNGLAALRLKVPSKQASISEDCPYQYLLNIYGRNHFIEFARRLSLDLESSNPKKWRMVLEIMDAVHFCLILVDDITDNSDFRHGYPTAHRLFGSSETANRAYLCLVRVMNKALMDQPQLVPPLLRSLEEILDGQDISLVWRRDGIKRLPSRHEDRMNAYRQSAYLKTGALFRLLGQLVFEDQSHDDLLTRVGWHNHLQNDCKNVYSTDYAKAKGAVAEDLRNGEFTYPIILALNAPGGSLVEKAMRTRAKKDIKTALKVIQSDSVRSVCLQELEQVALSVEDFVKIWGRKEKLDIKAS